MRHGTHRMRRRLSSQREEVKSYKGQMLVGRGQRKPWLRGSAPRCCCSGADGQFTVLKTILAQAYLEQCQSPARRFQRGRRGRRNQLFRIWRDTQAEMTERTHFFFLQEKTTSKDWDTLKSVSQVESRPGSPGCYGTDGIEAQNVVCHPQGYFSLGFVKYLKWPCLKTTWFCFEIECFKVDTIHCVF